MIDLSFLQSVDIFSPLSEQELMIIASSLRKLDIEKDVLLFAEGDKGEELFVVISGKLGISVSLADGGSIEVAEFGPGDFFGEMSIFEGAPRSAGCRAKEKSVLMSLKTETFFSFSDKYPETAIKIMHRMLNISSGRLRATNKFLNDMVRWGESARKRAVTDELTGLFNRGFFDAALEQRVAEAAGSGTPLSLAMVDLDGFGSLNARYGESVCNRIIRNAADVFSKVFTETDILTRYGGDEFAFILPGRPLREAQQLCDTVCSEIRSTVLHAGIKGPPVRVTSSIGLASVPEHAGFGSELVKAADSALYEAKELGRDRVACYRGRD